MTIIYYSGYVFNEKTNEVIFTFENAMNVAGHTDGVTIMLKEGNRTFTGDNLKVMILKEVVTDLNRQKHSHTHIY